MKSVRCSGCGADVEADSEACPLCGAKPTAKVTRRATESVSVEDYQSNVRELREKLRKLRDKGAEAV